MINYLYKNTKTEEIIKLSEFKKDCWVKCIDPTEEELELLKSVFLLDESLLNDALDPYELARTERDDGYLYIFIRVPFEKNNKLATYPLLIVIGDDFFLTLSKENLSIYEDLNKIEINTTQKTKSLIQILLLLNENFSFHIHQIGRRINRISNDIEKIHNKEVIKLVEYERMLNDFNTALIRGSIIFDNLMYKKELRMYKSDQDLIEDMSLSNSELIEICNTNLKYISNIREAYSTIISNNLNRVMKILTMFTALFAIPTFVTSFFGMNMPLPFSDNPFGFILIFLFISLSTFGLLFLFWRKDLF